MNRIALAAMLLASTSLVAQQQATQPKPTAEPQIAAVVNGETITKAKLDAMYAALGPQLRAQYDRAGGKMAFLDNYVAKRLLIQEAIKTGFDKKPEVQSVIEAAKESALFDRYVREQVASQVVSDAEVKQYYEQNQATFETTEQVKVRHIVATWNNSTKERAMEQIQRAATALHPYRTIPGRSTEGQMRILQSRFSEAARQYSQDGTAPAGGEMGWVGRQGLDPAFAEAAFNIQPGVMSGIIESQAGYHLILVEDKRPAGVQPFEEVRNDIREFLLADRAADVVEQVKRLTNELRAASKVALFPEVVNAGN